MNTVPTKNSNSTASDDAPATIPQTTPASIGYGHPEYHFVQALSEVNKTLGEIGASIKTLDKSVESTKSKVEDLVKWKNMILGGTIVAGVMISAIAFLISKASDYMTLKPQVTQTLQAPLPSPPTPKAP